MIVTDGFTGNVALKTIEGTARAVADGGPRRGALGPASPPPAGCCCGPRSAACAGRWIPTRTGGAILLGLRGVAVVGHGSSGPDGIANAVRLAARAVDERAVERTARAARSARARPGIGHA